MTLASILLDMGRKSRQASLLLAEASTEQKNQSLIAMAKHLRLDAKAILNANAKDIAAANAKAITGAFLDRLTFDETRLESIAQGLEAIATLPDPVGALMAQWQRADGLHFSRVRVPIGVIGIIYESRPNVTADAGALCLKSGNGVILRGGSDSFHSSSAIVNALQKGLAETGLPKACIQLVPSADREAVGLMLAGLDGNIDLIVPRGGKSLVARVQQDARVPVFAHLDGNNHVYVHEAADPDMARDIVLNSKMRRTGICGAAETLLVDEKALPLLPAILASLHEKACEIRGDEKICALDPKAIPATQEDWQTEYLDAVLAVRVVSNMHEAITHIAKYGSHHTDCIITQDETAAEAFLSQVDSAIVLHNAPTQFADGGEFGFGAEIGIATGRLHARGPVGLEQLTAFKYQVRGKGHVRA